MKKNKFTKFFKGVCITALLFISLIVISFFLQKKALYLKSNKMNFNYTVELPLFSFGLVKDHVCKVIKLDSKSVKSEILFNWFDRPILFYLDELNNEIYCLYNFDIKSELFIFEMVNQFLETPEPLKNIVLNSEVKIRRNTVKDVSILIKAIESMEFNEIKQLSLPTLDFGYYKYFLSKDKVISILKGLEK